MSKGKYFSAIPGLISIRCRLAVLRVDMKVGCKEGNCNRLNYLLRRSRRRIWVVNQWKILILVDGGLYKVISRGFVYLRCRRSNHRGLFGYCVNIVRCDLFVLDNRNDRSY
jgi:hypothetical protein